MAEQSDWVRVGQPVVIVNYNSWGANYGVPTTISKVHKTGRFVLIGEDRQWTPFQDRATQSGNHYGSGSVRPLTEELKADMAKAAAVAAARKVVREESERLGRLRADDDVLAAAAAITAGQSK